MSQFRCYMNVEGADRPIRGSKLNVQESYNGGWAGSVVITPPPTSRYNKTNLLIRGFASNLRAGQRITIFMALAGADPVFPDGTREEDGSLALGTIVKLWPSVITSMSPFDDSNGASLAISFADPLTFLSDRPVYGAYRLTSLAEIIGGGLSLAIGGEGKPTLQPLLSDLPQVRIINDLRQELDIIPYCVAAGEPFGVWLSKLEGFLGIRTETLATSNADVEIRLTDKVPSGKHLRMPVTIDERLLDSRTDEEDRRSLNTNGNLYISSIQAKPGAVNRGIVLDDPMLGGFTRVGTQTSVGTVVNVSGIGVEEATRRLEYELTGIFSEMLTLNVRSRQPAIRPGRIVNTGSRLGGIHIWQVSVVEHSLNSSGVYNNAAQLINGEVAWHPPYTLNTSPVIITGIVNGGSDYVDLEPVPRDRLGRIPVTLSFLPSPLEEEAERLRYADTNLDGRLTLEDFEESDLNEYEENAAEWRTRVLAYRNNEYADPYPGVPDADLTEEQRSERTANRESREAVVRYMASIQARSHDRKDRDRDGYISKRDQAISSELSLLLDEAGARARIREQLDAREAGTIDELFTPEERLSDELLDEFENLFGSGAEDGEENSLQRDAKAVQERWPPRIPITAIEPMAGGAHGFIPAHRQGDICRIAVHNPLYIELVGYQYRSDRQINGSVVNVSAGMIVEHNYGAAWSGLVFLTTEPSEEESTTDPSEEESTT